MSEQREALAEVLAAHQSEQLWKAGGWVGDTACSCGWRMAMWSRKDFPKVHRQHVAEALTDALARLLADAEQRGADEGVAALLAAAEQCQFPVPPRVSLREDNGYVSMTTLRLCAAALTTGAADRVRAEEGGDRPTLPHPASVPVTLPIDPQAVREAQAVYDAEHDPSDYHCLSDPCLWHPFEQRMRPTPRYPATLAEEGDR